MYFILFDFILFYFILLQLLSLAFTWCTGVHEHVHSFEQAGGWSMTQKSPTNEDDSGTLESRTCLRDEFHGDQQVFGWPFGFSVSSCWFALTKEHLLS